jgi:UDP-2,4-diacetamido-2,4,6-trideoxy-beta-L-altropyranose hydrolase
MSHCEGSSIKQRIEKEGFQFVPINRIHPHPSDSDQIKKATSAERLNTSGDLWVAIDGYHLGHDYQEMVEKTGCKALVIDDTAHLSAYCAHVLLNQNVHANHLSYDVGHQTRLLLGTRYALLRGEFLRQGGRNKRLSGTGHRILVTLGGSDPHNVTLKVIQGLELLNDRPLEIRVLAGPSNPHLDTLSRALSSSPFGFELVTGSEDMPELIRWADMAVSAGGTTCLELALMGVPFVIIAVAENQKPVAAAFESQGAGISLGWHEEVMPEKIRRVVHMLLEDETRRISLSSRARVLVDGRGANRVIEAMIPTELYLRKAGPGDCRLVWEWANEPETRSQSFSSDFIPMETHRRWFENRIKDAGCPFYISSNQWDIPIGQARFDMNESKAYISVSLGPEFRGIGLGSRLIRCASKRFMEERDVKEIWALVKQNNVASIAAFEKAGYGKIGEKIHKGFKTVQLVYGKDR